MFPVLLALVVAQPLELTHVEVLTAEEAITTLPDDARALPSVDRKKLSPQARKDLAVLLARFGAAAAELSTEEFRKRHKAKWPGTVAVARAGDDGDSTWTLTANAFSFEASGDGDCNACHCTRTGCGECRPSRESDLVGFCTLTGGGQQLIITSRVVGRSLVREHRLLQRVDWVHTPEPVVVDPPRPPPFAAIVVSGAPEDPDIEAVVLRRAGALHGCTRNGVPSQPIELQLRFSPVGRVFVLGGDAGTPSKTEVCLRGLLRSILGPAREDEVNVTVRFEPKAP